MAALLRDRSSVLTWCLAGLLVAAACGTAGPGYAAGRLLDMVLADVNGAIVTASDVAIARALGLFGMEPSPASIRAADVQRLVDARLIEGEAAHLQITSSPAEIDAAWQAAADRLGGTDVLRRWLDQAGLDEGWVRKLVEADVRRQRFIDLRFRAFVFVTEEELTQALGSGPHTPEQRERARDAVREAATTRELTAWLTGARAGTTIRYADLGAGGVPLPFAMAPGAGP
jgi:hypothetical protein